MFLSKSAVMDAINAMHRIHPFFGITFLACKRNCLSIGTTEEFHMDYVTKQFMEAANKLDPDSQYYFQPFRSNSKGKNWVAPNYPSSGLQAINTQTFKNAFIHKKGSKLWGWTTDYVRVLSEGLQGGHRLPAAALAVWVFRNEEWLDNPDINALLTRFNEYFYITEAEKDGLFDYSAQDIELTNEMFQDLKVTWNDLRGEIQSPPDVGPDRGGILTRLHLENVGPVESMDLIPSSRLNIITGDNGLGKSFLMECIWWALTGVWAERPAYPKSLTEPKKSRLSFEIVGKRNSRSAETVKYDPSQASWPRKKNSSTLPGLIVYGRVDGSYAIWDPMRQNVVTAGKTFVISGQEVWDGQKGNIEGLIRDWVKWQTMPAKYPFDVLVKVLAKMSPPDLGFLEPGEPVRIVNEIREIPTLRYPYGLVPIVNSSAGVRRIITLAYLIVWAWNEHKIRSEQSNNMPEARMVIIIDEIEAHLHPKWQRVILPALLEIQGILSSELDIQFFVSTHSPLVLASAESHFDDNTDSLFHLNLRENSGDIELDKIDFIRYGQVGSWLTSPVFDMRQARSQAAEMAIEEAKRIQLAEHIEVEEIEKVHNRLVQVLAENDPFWPRWIYFAERNGVKI